MDYYIVILIALLPMLVFWVPQKVKSIVAVVCILIVSFFTTRWAFSVFNLSMQLHYNIGLPFYNNATFTIDPLSAFFILVINFTVITGVLFGSGYIKQYLNTYKPIKIAIHFFSFVWLHYAMLLLCMLRSGSSFLIAWEIMSVTSFLLVIFEGGKKNIIKTGINYLIQMHIGFIFILAAFIVVEKFTGIFGFNGLSNYFNNNSNIWLFLLFFVGFGIKAGFIPLHSWLPEAHPAAPSHVSGIMSGVMIKMGIYGILRVIVNLQSDYFTIGIIVLIISLITGITGILFAVMQKDMKRMLAFSSIENIGIIGIGIGLGLIGLGKSNPFLVVFGFTGALLHIVNHSLFKSLLFYSAGSVYMATHTRNIDRMGGLMKQMPYTGGFFLMSIIAVCALPPLNGFISEFLLYSGLYEGLSAGNSPLTVLILIAIVSLALIGGISIFAFSRVFGIAFLGTKRDAKVHQANEVSKSMLISKLVVLIPIVFIGLMPVVVLKYLNYVALKSFTIAGIMVESPVCFCGMQKVSWVFWVLIFVFALLFVVRRMVQKNRLIKTGPTWGCGYTAITPRHQYSTASYGNDFANLVSYVVKPQTVYKPIDETDIFPEKRSFELTSTDAIKENLIEQPANKLVSLLRGMARLQTGRMQHYVLYALLFLLLVLLLTFLGVI